MQDLINALPDRNGKTEGSMTLWYGVSSVNKEGQNQLSQAQYEALVDKNWVVKTAIPNAPYTGPFEPFDVWTNVEEKPMNDELIIQKRENGLVIVTQKAMPVSIYNISGQLVHKEELLKGEKFIPLKKGNSYLINNKKIVL